MEKRGNAANGAGPAPLGVPGEALAASPASALSRATATPPRGAVDIRRLLHWAIGHQKAHRAAFAAGAFDEDRWVHARGVDSISIVASVGLLGTLIDNAPGWWPRAWGVDEDAAKVFCQVQACLSSWRVYRLVMSHAELGTEPDWRPGARTRIEPCARDAQGRAVETSGAVEYPLAIWRMRQHSRATGRLEEYEATGARPCGRGWRIAAWLDVTVQKVRHTPVVIVDAPDEVVAARLEYSTWWAALRDLAGALSCDAGGEHGLERWSRVTHGAPAHPWPRADDAAFGRLAVEVERARRERLHHATARARGFDTSGTRPLDKPGGY